MKNLTLNPNIKLYTWQSACLKTWAEHDHRGTVDVVTGGGKTIFAIAALCECSRLSSRPLRARIVLPKHSLIRQWIHALRSSISESLKIGEWHGIKKDAPDCDVMIYIVNSARHAISTHILRDQSEGYATLLIADECHHYTNGENRKIFHFIQSPAFVSDFFYSVGLSATLDGNTIPSIMRTALGERIYSYGVSDALADQHIAPFTLFRVQVSLNAEENSEYDIIIRKMTLLIHKIKNHYPHLANLPLKKIMEECRQMQGNDFARDAIEKLEILIRQRQRILVMASSRIPCALKLIRELSEESQILIFCERIAQASELYEEISKRITSRVSIYHSELTDNIRKNALENFKSGDARILVSCRALDEGIDVPSCDVGIILSSSSSERQHIQRLGRILRTSPGKVMASIYYVYALDKEDSSYLPGDCGEYSQCDLKYLHEEDDFVNLAYEDLALTILEEKKSSLDSRQIEELRECLIEGLIKADCMLDEEIILDRMRSTSDRHRRNYWYACLLLSRTSQGDVSL